MNKNRIKIISVLGLLLSAVLMIAGIYTGLTSSVVSGSSNSSAQKQSSTDDKYDNDKKSSEKGNNDKDLKKKAEEQAKREQILEKRMGGGYGSDAQSYAPEGSQTNPETDVARAYWACSPQSIIDDLDFRYQLSDDQSEMTLRFTKPYDANQMYC